MQEAHGHVHNDDIAAHRGRRPAVSATVHCLPGCAIGEVLGMVISPARALTNPASIVVSIALAFFFGYAPPMRPLPREPGPRRAIRLAFASDTVSITTMEIVD